MINRSYLHKNCFIEFFANEFYHIYNRGNNKQKIFFIPGNYIYFLKKIRRYIMPYCDIIAYCLMPNHFHLLIHSDQRTVSTKSIGGKEKNILSEGIKNLLSSYTQAINKQNGSTGSLFQQNTKATSIVKGSENYDLICFHYIHQNPLTAKLAKRMEDWPYSSFSDYCGFRNGTLCHKESAIQLLDLNIKSFYKDSYKMIGINDIKNIL
ncbi:MAG: transposase [Chitinophagales bacterium]